MKNNLNQPNGYDLAFIGSGIAASFSILNFLKRIEGLKQSTPLRIAIIEKNSEFHAGIPYGNRSTTSCLLITSLADFLPQPELGDFLIWLNENKEWLIESFKKDGGNLSHEWLNKHEKEIEENKWEDLFLPRRFFGWYINEKVSKKIEKAVADGNIIVDYFNEQVTNVTNEGSQYAILGENTSWSAHKVVLSIGSLPPKDIAQNIANQSDKDLLVISDPYGSGLDKSLARISNFLKKRNEGKANVLIVGANASALEMLYKLNDDKELDHKIHKFYFLSTLGLIPDSEISLKGLATFKANNLLLLKDKTELTAKEIAEAAYADLDEAEGQGIGAATTVKIISEGFGNLLHLLNDKELENFACLYGNDIGRRQRCAGKHYTGTVKMLESQNRFEHLKGRYVGLMETDTGNHYLKYLQTSTGQEVDNEVDINVLISCIGSMNLTSEDIPELHKNLISSGLCTPNDSKIGFAVNQNLESASDLHIVGPLLAGNVIKGKALWHLEHCGRIIWSSKVLSETLFDYFYD